MGFAKPEKKAPPSLEMQLDAVLDDIATIKPGMTRGQLKATFSSEDERLEGIGKGIYLYKKCPVIRIEVEFRAVGLRKESIPMDQDLITKISKPYLEKNKDKE